MMVRLLKAHLLLSSILAVVVVGGMIFVLVWFQPQKLFIEQTVDEALPQPMSAVSPDDDAEGDATVLAEGDFQRLEHPTSGTASIIELADGSRFLRFEELDTSNGPDLRVYLSEIPVSDDWYAYGKRFVDLGALKGNRGNQNYALPPDLDLERYESAVIWCRRFTVGFGVAPLQKA